jgi:hypothetical protein
MAEIICFLRGDYAGMQEYISLLRSTYWPHKAREMQADGTVKTINAMSRLGVTQIMPVSIVCPENSIPWILGMIHPEGNKPDHILDSSMKTKFLKSQMQKAFNLNPLPVSWKKFNQPVTDFLAMQHVTAHLIGIKYDDKYDGVENL